jgi:hypothetical protein
MSSPTIICRPETGENMSAQKKKFGGTAPEPPHGGLPPLHPPRGASAAPPLTPLRARRRRSDTTTRAKNITHTQQQPDIDGKRGKWITQILEFDLEIKPTKLIKGQGLAKLLADSNYRALGINFINEQVELSNRSSQSTIPLAACPWYKDILYFLQELRPPDGMEKSKARALKLKVVRYCLIDQTLYWKDPLGGITKMSGPTTGPESYERFP